MLISPDTTLRILKCPLELDNKNQLTFNSKNAQLNYFNSLPFLEIDEISYQRKDGTIRFPGHIDTIIQYNYCMYQNSNYGNKWFFAFITDMKYLNDNVTEISISTDVYQTWQFDLTFKKCFVEREHVSDDKIGLHTIPEGLEHGEYIIDNLVEYGNLSDYVYIIRVSQYIDGTKVYATNFGGIFSARWCLCL